MNIVYENIIGQKVYSFEIMKGKLEGDSCSVICDNIDEARGIAKYFITHKECEEVKISICLDVMDAVFLDVELVKKVN